VRRINKNVIGLITVGSSGTQEPTYDWAEGELTPANEFTKCFDRELYSLKALGETKAREVGKILCRYGGK